MEWIPDDLIFVVVASPIRIRFVHADAVMSRADSDPGSDMGSDAHSLENSALYDCSPAGNQDQERSHTADVILLTSSLLFGS